MDNRVNCWKPKMILAIIMVISSQAWGNAISTREGSETRGVTSVMNNRLHECPTPQRGEDIVRYSFEKRRAEDKKPRHNILYAGIARGSAAYFESSASTTNSIAGLRSLHATVRSPDKGGSPTAHLVSSTVLEWYLNKVGGPQATSASTNGTLRYVVSANTGAPAFDLGHNLYGHSFMGRPVIEVPDLTSTVWLMLDTSAQNMKHVIIRPFQVKFHSNMGDSEVYEISTGSLLAVEQPKWQGILSSIS